MVLLFTWISGFTQHNFQVIPERGWAFLPSFFFGEILKTCGNCLKLLEFEVCLKKLEDAIFGLRSRSQF